MLFIQFYLDEYRYVLPTADVIEMTPAIKLTRIPKAPRYISGLCDYHGQSVPVVDLCELFLDRPCNKKLSTRIIFIRSTSHEKTKKVIGLMAEKATETLQLDEDSFVDSGFYSADMPFIGPVAADTAGLVSRIKPSEIFSQIDRELLMEQYQ